MKDYKKGDVVYIAGVGEHKPLTYADLFKPAPLSDYEVFDSFIDDGGNKHYILRSSVPGIGEWHYVIREWATIAEKPEGPLNFHSKENMDRIREMFRVMQKDT